MSDLKGYSQMVTACILYGLIGIFVELIGDMPVGSIIFYRLFFGLAAIAVYLAVSGRFSELKVKEKKGYLLLLYTAPIYVTLLSPLLLKEKNTSRSILSLALSIAGGFIMLGAGIISREDRSKNGSSVGLRYH